MQYPESGDTIEISSIALDNLSPPDLTYHIKIISSTINAYVPTNDSAYSNTTSLNLVFL